MKKIIALLLLGIVLISCKSMPKNISKATLDSIKNETNTFLNNWHQAASDANFNGYFNKMDSVAVYIGTDASENWNVKEFKAFSKPYFDNGKAWDFKTLERNIYANNTGDFVWFDELLDTWMGTCRGSGVLIKLNGSWKIKQYVLSVAIPNDDVQAVIATKKKNDAIFLKKFN